MTEEVFIESIANATGKVLGRDYGFIMGTMAPWPTKAGMMSATMADGFYVWRKDKDGTDQKILLRPKSQKESLEQVIRFLKADAQEIMKMEAGL